MFFTTLIAAPILAGLVAGVWTRRHSVSSALTVVCITLGLAGVTASAFNPDGRTDNITFSLIASIVCGGLVWAGYAAGRLTRRAARTV